ncbi:site-specific DNA-methyltransferase [Erythrobacter sp. EC-HK427]|uniref:site-specific DNA-methyltransferase n=1 Tax=Erythrobacter sp. EC-HK427 TaxID=2038396 RepID=UPI0012562A23|nr:site-specific DNA-methyltransferase [Erythrobacter sp. EC-HK427]VVT07154.1 Methyltransferase [Erythrobacter sp. EC-HK427]
MTSPVTTINRIGHFGHVQIGRGEEILATLHLGDAYAIRPSLGFIDCDVTDPPFLLRTSGGGRYRKARKSMSEIADAGIDDGFDLAIFNTLQCGSVVCFCHNDQLPTVLPALAGQFHRFALLDWTKANPQPVANKHYRPDREFYIHAWNKGFHPQGDLADKGRSITAAPDRSLKKRFEHPTIKPPAVMDKIMRNITGETVCDAFMGTGSTGVAAIQAGKRFIGIERDARWFEAAVTRISEAVEALD